MTDRHLGYMVTLDHELREDDAQPIVTALSAIRGVVSVKPIVGNMDHALAKGRALHKLRQKLWEALKDD